MDRALMRMRALLPLPLLDPGVQNFNSMIYHPFRPESRIVHNHG